VAGSRKEKSNAIPGVAIATALMPPLCTAGYGIATGNAHYFIGAFYLFFINSVFISLATFLIVRLLRFPKKEFTDAAQEKRVKTWLSVVVLITLLPSVWLAYLTVKRTVFEQNALQFIDAELNFENTRVIGKTLRYDANKPVIEVTLFGEPLSEERLNDIKKELAQYNLAHADLTVIQGYDPATKSARFSSPALLEELLRTNESRLRTREEQLAQLEQELTAYRALAGVPVQLAHEVKALFPDMLSFSVSQTLAVRLDSIRPDTLYVALVHYRKKPAAAELQRLREWLAARLQAKKVEVIVKP
jgi:uncharacterized membrane protein